MIVSASRVGTTARQGLQGRCHPEPCATYIIRCALPSIPRFDGSCCERILQQCAKFPRLKAQRRRLLIPTSWNGTWMLHVGTGSIQFCWCISHLRSTRRSIGAVVAGLPPRRRRSPTWLWSAGDIEELATDESRSEERRV